MGVKRFLDLFSNICKISTIKRAERIDKSTDY